MIVNRLLSVKQFMGLAISGFNHKVCERDRFCLEKIMFLICLASTLASYRQRICLELCENFVYTADFNC